MFLKGKFEKHIMCFSDFSFRNTFCVSVKLGVRTETSGPKSCEALASTCRLRRSLAGCLEFRRSGRSRRVRSRAKKKLEKDKSKLRRSRLLS